ncbi:protein FAM78B isoform X2 [Heliangelus exortis]|uniref:protein FAM78B isoform X2 n=1 Tax=Heliangelus exortis TaxID=472823 RepID=UPI003A8DC67C
METGRLFAAPPGGAEVRPLPPGAGTQGTAPPARCTAAGEGHKCHGGGAFAPPVRAPVRGRRCAAAAAVGRGKRRGAGLPPTRPRGSAAAGEGGSVAMGCLQSVACKARVRREQIVVSDVSATIEPAATAIEESSPVVLRYRTPYFRASARVLMPPIARRHTWVVGWIQACNHMEFYNTYSDLGVSSWELPDLREGRVKAISDSDGVSYPWYGNTTETVTLVGPTNKISRFSSQRGERKGNHDGACREGTPCPSPSHRSSKPPPCPIPRHCAPSRAHPHIYQPGFLAFLWLAPAGFAVGSSWRWCEEPGPVGVTRTRGCHQDPWVSPWSKDESRYSAAAWGKSEGEEESWFCRVP